MWRYMCVCVFVFEVKKLNHHNIVCFLTLIASICMNKSFESIIIIII